ncbi:hypothetical protein D8796_05960 [Streptococcus cristatus]|uniref:Uncharacterized protein n=1 Tax=Streptococcus cristatus TaxID=45634 RepID=A0A428GSC5_STRCR|nr:Imm6 family immunity protein [Streptococcus cristatus]RSJ75928.1 hypothetical protein D8795_11345 [Streptococcus cristatus]RSJ79579.1 hypothetical protein D8796_05960 [Streptococcus cristatus]RSJ84656.1 hypothetical protein D8794_08470 [Streptococcus cristatus]RSJ86680.1 hypothetical protein D8793_02380 [Streptococcus cristatus]
MEFTLNLNLLQFMQKLTEPLETYIGNSDYKEFVHETLDIAGRFIDRLSESDPDFLYDRLENLDEEDILTYSELDKSTDPAVWRCIDSFIALVVYQSYKAVGQRYLPQTIECVDEDTLEDYFIHYKQLVRSYSDIARKTKLLEKEAYVSDSSVIPYLEFLFKE